MLCVKKALSLVLCLVLVSSMMPLAVAWADEGTDSSDSEATASADASETPVDQGSEEGGDDSGSTDSTPSSGEEFSEPETPLDETLGSEGESEEESSRDYIRVAAIDAIEYVFLDEAIVALDQEQNIAFGLLDSGAAIEQAQAYFIRADNGETEVFDSALAVENTALFTMSFTELEDATSYRLVGISYKLSNSEQELYADFSTDSIEQEGGSYFFEVVTQEVLDVLVEAPSEDGEVSAFAIQDDGEFVAAESVEDAIVVADASGSNDISVGDSVVDTETLAATGGVGAAPEEESWFSGFGSWFEPELAYAAASSARENYLIVALDPGHGGGESGAIGNGLQEKDLNWKIANAARSELAKYTGVSTILTRGENERVGLQARVDRAVHYGADVFISLHNNAGGATGAEVWVPNTSSYLYNETHVQGKELGTKILAQLSKLGLTNRGIKTSNTTTTATYPDGSKMDFFTVIAASRQAGIPGIIVEHAFIDNGTDAAKLKSDSFLAKLGVADAVGVANQYSLVSHGTAQSNATVKYQAHVANIGWESFVYDQKVAGTTGKSMGMEALSIQLQGQKATGGIEYQSYVTGSGWQGWKSNGDTSGTVGKSATVQALQVRLTGEMANKYDVYYRVHVANIGWLGWAKNGASAGSVGYNYDAQAFEVVVVAKGSSAPGSTATPFKTKQPSNELVYQAYVAKAGWLKKVPAGSVAGTIGQGSPIEALKMSFDDQLYSGDIEYNAHCAYVGWQGWKSNGAQAGTTGLSRSVEAVRIRLTGEMANKYDVYYRVHSAYMGWLGWAKNGADAGTAGYGRSMEALEVRLVAKNGTPPGSTANAYMQSKVTYKAHVSQVGWQTAVFDGGTAGTVGKGRAVEALSISLPNMQYSGGIEYDAHCAYIGWQGWKSNGAQAGTTGLSRSVEAVRIRLTGEMANKYDVYYRVHSAYMGWLGWAKNGADAGTAGYGRSMEALEVRLVTKNGTPPGSTANAYMEKKVAVGTPVMGSSKTTVDQMVKRYNAMGKAYPSSVYAKYGAKDIREFCTILFEEAKAEGVRAEVVFAQAMHETGWLQFGGDVKADQCNFAGLGATGGVPGNSFNDWGVNSVRKGLRAQVQHLKAYASTASLSNACVDLRFSYVQRGCAPTVEELSQKWATGSTYGQALVTQINSLLAT